MRRISILKMVSKVVQICNSRNVLSAFKIKEHLCKAGPFLMLEWTTIVVIIAKKYSVVKSPKRTIKLAIVMFDYRPAEFKLISFKFQTYQLFTHL